MKKRYQHGFTLIELLVVIAIIGILSSIVLASLNSARSKGRDARRLSDIKQLQLALELYYDANGHYPVALSSSTLVTPGYIAAIPTDPSDGNSYSYAAVGASACTSYHLGATLETAGHSAFDSDTDACAASGTCAHKDAAICSGSATTDFSGDDSSKCATGDAGVGCYDVTP